MPHNYTIGSDIGHSAVKTVVKAGSTAVDLVASTDIFPTVVRDWIPIANETTARKAEADTVIVNGKKFFVGVTAQRQSQAETFSGHNRDWIETEQHDALLMASWSRAMAVLENNKAPRPDQISLVLGLPASYYSEQRDILRARASSLLKPLIEPDQELDIYIESQSRAPLLCVVFNERGGETGRGTEDETWGVVEIGQFTTDFTLHDRGQEIDAATNSARGAHMVYDRIAASFKQRGYEANFDVITDAIKKRKIKDYGKEVDVGDIVLPALQEFSTYIQDEVAARFGAKARSMDGIVLAGGGAYLVAPSIKARYPNAEMLANPRFAVAEGYARFGLLTLM